MLKYSLQFKNKNGRLTVLDLFTNKPSVDDFQWMVALFSGYGATDVIRRANDVPLKTYFPIRFNGKGEPIPLWRNYLFIEFRDKLTLEICRSTSRFLKVLSIHDDEGVLKPILVRKDAINDHLEMLMRGHFNDRLYLRRFYGKGSFVRVIEGIFIDKRVRLEMDIEPGMPGNKKVLVDINGCRGSIELWKLAL
jgi:hypothetical protein